jgi:hypothetical protein
MDGTLAARKKSAARGFDPTPTGSKYPSESRGHPIAEIEAPELVVIVKAIEQCGACDIARRALETTGQVFHYGIAHGYTKRNPAPVSDQLTS